MNNLSKPLTHKELDRLEDSLLITHRPHQGSKKVL
jgi:hypothetical protein